MIRPLALHAAVDEKFPESGVQSVADRKHHIGVVLFHREDLRPLRDIAQRVEISQDHIRDDAQLFQVGDPSVGGDGEVILFNWKKQRIKFRCSEYHTSGHSVCLL